MAVTAPKFPHALRSARSRRRLSQLDLAIRAGTSQRHLSFIEQGRSHPGRGMVIRLAESLELPLRERNGLLLAAGYAPAYPRTNLDDPALLAVRDALQGILDGHDPYPALVTDRYGGVVATNRSMAVMLDGVAPELLVPPWNALRVALHPDGLARRTGNLAEWGQHIIVNLRHELARNPDERLETLLSELEGYMAHHDQPAPDESLGFSVPLELSSVHGPLRLMTTIATFATAIDVTVAELRLEAFLPADPATAAALVQAAAERSA
jgi:transcriptional regulator with XRE-family HTH domain